MTLTAAEIALLQTAAENWEKTAQVPATIGEWLVPTSLGEVIKMANVWAWEVRQ